MSPSSLQSPYIEKLLSNLQFQGYTNNCGPTTAATVCNALLNLDLRGPELAEQMNRIVWKGIVPKVRRIPNSATLPWGMVDIFHLQGLQSKWRLFARTSYLFEGLARGLILMPMIGSLKPFSAHVMTLVAWDREKGFGFANTAYEQRDIFWETDPRFRATWGTFKKSWMVTGHLLVMAKYG